MDGKLLHSRVQRNPAQPSAPRPKQLGGKRGRRKLKDASPFDQSFTGSGESTGRGAVGGCADFFQVHL